MGGDLFDDLDLPSDAQPSKSELEATVYKLLSQPGSAALTAKQVRAKLQECYLADLSGRKKEITAIVLATAEKKHAAAVAKQEAKRVAKRRAVWELAVKQLPRQLSEQEVRQSVERIIESATLESLTAKEIRKQLSVEYKIDMKPIKSELDALIMDCVAAKENTTQDQPSGGKSNKFQRYHNALHEAKGKLEAELKRLESEVKQEALEKAQGQKKRKGGMLILGDGEQSAKRMRIKQIQGRWLPELEKSMAKATDAKAAGITDGEVANTLCGMGLGNIWEQSGNVFAI